MKHLNYLSILAFLIFGLSATAAVHTVSNNTNSPGQFTNIVDAVNAAAAGDTIYVSGSTTSYGHVTIVKQLTLIGAGYNPDNQFNFKSQLGNIDLKVGNDGFGNLESNPSSTEVIGFEFSTITCSNNDINNVKLSRNRITSSVNFNSRTLSGWVVKNNIVVNLMSGSNLTNSIFANNIILGYFYYMRSTTINISNNIFTASSGDAFNQVEYAIVTNNIIYGKSTAGCNYCTFNNNISIGGAQTSFSYNNNTGDNNLENTNPMFVDVGGTTFAYTYDYHLQAASPGIDAGTDGTQIGLYGGTYSFPGGDAAPWQTSPMAPLPQILKMNILNSVLPVDGTLNVELEAVSNP